MDFSGRISVLKSKMTKKKRPDTLRSRNPILSKANCIAFSKISGPKKITDVKIERFSVGCFYHLSTAMRIQYIIHSTLYTPVYTRIQHMDGTQSTIRIHMCPQHRIDCTFISQIQCVCFLRACVCECGVVVLHSNAFELYVFESIFIAIR